MTSVATVYYEASATSLASQIDSDIPVATVVPYDHDHDNTNDDDDDESSSSSSSLSSSLSSSSTSDKDLQERLQSVLHQRRDIINFKQYAVSEEHVERMQELAQTLPEIFANPTKTQRTQWFRHPNYETNNQMPNLHVHYRLELQGVLLYLQKAFHQLEQQQQQQHDDENPAHASSLKSAYFQFKGSMEGLHRHIAVEEWKLFPVFQLRHPQIDLKFLYEDHADLHQIESKLLQALLYLYETSSALGSGGIVHDLKEQVVGTIQLALDFDQQLMTHLGEEEEIVVPLSLTLEGRLKY
ncbi:unnamed protein product [Cylindrotheca closterium]|uniref:Hemerythrin-like domain-containing protein n=1 Tax=Cylindrotheca closterium TaxID=2856 RepID=A0AAD2CN32_9STRA|nr:unnamed protein product [Cylindrotheca closterium]